MQASGSVRIAAVRPQPRPQAAHDYQTLLQGFGVAKDFELALKIEAFSVVSGVGSVLLTS